MFNGAGRFATLPDVVWHYDETVALHLKPSQVSNRVEYLKSL